MSRLAVVLPILLLPALALANGRPTQTRSVSVGEQDPDRILLGATFGLLLSEDGGTSFRWTCEGNIGFSGIWDPVYLSTRAGTLFATTAQGLSVSRDAGCNWQRVEGPLATAWIFDLTLGPDGAIWAVTSTSGNLNDAYVSRDDGLTFEPSGLVTDRGWWRSVRVAPDRPERIYVSGYQLADPMAPPDAGSQGSLPLMRVSDDGGETWTELPFEFEGAYEVFFVGVAAGSDGDVVFARVNQATKDTLLRSDDGALSWTPVLTLDGDKLDMVVAVLADGQHVVAGSFKAAGWSRVSSDGGLTWTTPSKQPEMPCVHQSGQGGDVYACGANWEPDYFALGRSADFGQSYTKVVRFIEFAGELECPAGSLHALRCSAEWPMWEQAFGIGRADAGPPPVRPDASIEVPEPPPKPDCGGCGVALGAVFLGSPWARRRRRR
jgi:hypothetical protein